MSERALQLAEIIHHELDNYILREVEWPMGSLGTITDIKVTDDLKIAFVSVSILPITKTGQVINMLRKRAKPARHFIAPKINIRQVPELRFIVDEGLLKERVVERAIENSDDPTLK